MKTPIYIVTRSVCLFIICISTIYVFIFGYLTIYSLVTVLQGKTIVDPKLGFDNWSLIFAYLVITILLIVLDIVGIFTFRKIHKTSNEIASPNSDTATAESK
jgi:hypothetical protein